jgi:hypothetical protein
VTEGEAVRLPIDLSKLTFIAGSDPAGVLDMERRPRADKATGELLWGLDLVVLGGEDGAEVWPLRVEGLTAMPWEIDGRHGMSFRARVVEAAGPAPAKGKPSATAASGGAG